MWLHWDIVNNSGRFQKCDVTDFSIDVLYPPTPGCLSDCVSVSDVYAHFYQRGEAETAEAASLHSILNY